MASGAWYKGILLTAVLSCLLHEAMADCSNEGDSRSCDQCYQTLSSFLVNTSDNNFRLRKTFFPPDKTPPDFVTVTYQYDNMSNVNQTWYWSAGVFYFFQPKQVFQFTSLFFGTGDFLNGTVTLTLPAQCENAPEDFMEQLTQMLKLYASWQNANPRIDDSYQAKAASLSTLRDKIYTNPYDVNASTPALLYCFQTLFPAFIAILITLCIWCSCDSIRNYVTKNAEDGNSWATTSVYAFMCTLITLVILALDIWALVLQLQHHNESTDYLREGNADHNSLFNYPMTVLMVDFIAVLCTPITVIIVMMCKRTRWSLKCHEVLFLFLTLTGVAPLICLASHTHYIIIAWLIHPTYASKIGIYYGITIFVYFFLLKQIYKRAYSSVDFSELKKICKKRCRTVSSCCGGAGESSQTLLTPGRSNCINGSGESTDNPTMEPTQGLKQLCNCCKPVTAMIVAFVLIAGCQAMFTVFFIMMPISHSIEDTPNTLYTIIQGFSALLLALVAYKVILDPRGSFSISDGVKNMLTNLKPKNDKLNTTKLYGSRGWDKLAEEEKLAELLYTSHGQKFSDNYTAKTAAPTAAENIPTEAATTIITAAKNITTALTTAARTINTAAESITPAAPDET